MKTMKVKLTFTDPILGGSPADEEIYTRFIASKSPDASTLEEEVAAIGVDAVAEKGMTVFPRTEDGKPFLYDYHIKGFFKETCGGLKRVKGSVSSGIKAYKKEIDKLIFPQPRQISFDFNGEVEHCQRPRRTQTMQGDRVNLANSEQIPAGASVTFEIVLLNDDHEKAVREWLDYGKILRNWTMAQLRQRTLHLGGSRVSNGVASPR